MDTLAGGAAALLSAMIWAYSATAMTGPARIWGGRATNFFKSAVGAALFLPAILVWLGPGALGISTPAWSRFLVSGLLGLAIADTAYLSALKHIGPTLTAIVYESSGIFTCVLGVVFLGERLSPRELVAIALVIGGVMLAILDDAPGHVAPGHRLRGALYGLCAAAFHSVGLVVNKAAFRELEVHDGLNGMHAAVLAGFFRMAASAVALLAFALVTRSLARQSAVLRAREGWRTCFPPALLGSFLAMATMQYSLTKLKAGVASVLLAMTPIFTIPVAWKMLNHPPSLKAVGGAVIAIVGAWMLANPATS